MSNHDLIVADNNSEQVQPLDYATLPQEVAEQLQRYEADCLHYLGDAQQSIQSLAFVMKAAHDLLAKVGRDSKWGAWVRRLYPTISRPSADRLVDIASRIETPSGRVTLPDGVSSIGAMAAYLAAPAAVQESVATGKTPGSYEKIREATLLAQKADARARELELALAKSADELAKIEATREQAEKTLEYALMESENVRFKLAEQEREMKARIAEATVAERERLENSYKAALYRAETDLKKTREEAEKNLKRANTDLKEARQTAFDLTEQLKRSRDQGAIWARWEIISVKFAKQIEQIIAEMPPEDEMAVYLDGHWKLLEDMGKRVDALSALVHDRLGRHARGDDVVDADQ